MAEQPTTEAILYEAMRRHAPEAVAARRAADTAEQLARMGYVLVPADPDE